MLGPSLALNLSLEPEDLFGSQFGPFVSLIGVLVPFGGWMGPFVKRAVDFPILVGLSFGKLDGFPCAIVNLGGGKMKVEWWVQVVLTAHPELEGPGFVLSKNLFPDLGQLSQKRFQTPRLSWVAMDSLMQS